MIFPFSPVACRPHGRRPRKKGRCRAGRENSRYSRFSCPIPPRELPERVIITRFFLVQGGFLGNPGRAGAPFFGPAQSAAAARRERLEKGGQPGMSNRGIAAPCVGARGPPGRCPPAEWQPARLPRGPIGTKIRLTGGSPGVFSAMQGQKPTPAKSRRRPGRQLCPSRFPGGRGPKLPEQKG